MNTPSDLQNSIIPLLSAHPAGPNQCRKEPAQPELSRRSLPAGQERAGLNAMPLLCTYSTEYEAIYEPGYDPVFFYSEEDEYEEYYEEVWDDFFPLPDSSGIGRA